MRRLKQWRCGVLVVIAVAMTASCSKDPYEAYAEHLPRRFVVARKGYLLDEHEVGVIHDDAVAYTADAGARTFDFKSRTILRHLYVGTTENFTSLPADEWREAISVANGALTFIARLEKKQRVLSDIDRRHRDLLNAFVIASGASQRR